MEIFIVGNQYPQAKVEREFLDCNLVNGVISISMGFVSPSADIVKSFLAEAGVNISYIKINSVIFILLKFENLDWIAVPYSVHLDKKIGGKKYPEDGEGFAIRIRVFDTSTGILCQNPIYALPVKASAELIKIIQEQEKEPFDQFQFDFDTMMIKLFYSTEDLVQLAMKEPNE